MNPEGAHLFPGLIAEYRENGRLLGVMTGVETDRTIHVQHVMVWPGAPTRALLKMILAVEAQAWLRDIDALVVDVEHEHPAADQLKLLAVIRGFALFHESDRSDFYVKYRRRKA